VPRAMCTVVVIQYHCGQAFRTHLGGRSPEKRGCGLQPRDFIFDVFVKSAFFLQVPKSRADLDPTLLYISMRGTYSNLLRENKILTLCVQVCFPKLCQSAGRRFAVQQICGFAMQQTSGQDNRSLHRRSFRSRSFHCTLMGVKMFAKFLRS